MNALIEILTEELPVSYIEPALNFLKNSFKELLEKNKIKVKDIKTFATPRRLVLFFEDIKENTKEEEKVIVGPPISVVEKNPKALTGFLKKFKAKQENLKIEENPQGRKGTYYVLYIKEKPKSFEEVLKENFEKIVLNIPFPKKMKWDTSKISFARPIRNLLALLDEKVLDIKIGNIKATNKTFGHKIMAPISLKVNKADLENYKNLLRKNFVILSQEDRKNLIRKSLSDFTQNEFQAISPESLIEEITYLVENVYPVSGSFEKKYLSLPRELIYLVLKVHQRMFAFEKDGRVLPVFLGISNTLPEDIDTIRKGYEKVVKARLEDAYFYYQEDLKIPLSKRKELLKDILFHEKFGSLYDFVEALKDFERKISPYLKEKDKTYASLEKDLNILFDIYKNDLTTHLVDEFDELQGIIGKYYALKEGFKENIAKAIEEVYKENPESLLGAYLSLLDKIMALCAFFVIGERVKGNYDPYGLRRLANTILNILLNPKFKLDLDLEKLIETALEVYKEKGFKVDNNLKQTILDFIKDRLKFRLLEENKPYDLVLVVLEENVPYRAYEKLKALETLYKEKEFRDLLIAFRRIFNILKNNETYFNVNEPEPTSEYEKKLLEALEKLKPELDKYEKNMDYLNLYKALASLKEKVDLLFDNVMIMEKDEVLREKRLKTLGYIAKTLRKYGDFSKLGLKR